MPTIAQWIGGTVKKSTSSAKPKALVLGDPPVLETLMGKAKPPSDKKPTTVNTFMGAAKAKDHGK